jgi:hypothetical protein
LQPIGCVLSLIRHPFSLQVSALLPHEKESKMTTLKQTQGMAAAVTAMCAGALLLVLTLPAAAWDSGSGVEKTETRNPGAFSRIEASGATRIEVTAGQAANSVVISGDDNVVPLVKTTVSDGVLRITMEDVHNTKLPLILKISTPKLTAFNGSGATRLNVSNLSGERFEMTGSGSTKAELGGKVDNLVLKTSGAGNVDAVKLAVRTAEIKTSGASHVDVNASEKLSVSISGAGKVNYKGNPTVSQSISGAGKVQAIQ